jgi:hypothetical protein
VAGDAKVKKLKLHTLWMHELLEIENNEKIFLLLHNIVNSYQYSGENCKNHAL